MNNLFRKQNLKIKLLIKKQGVKINLSLVQNFDFLFDELAHKLQIEDVGFVLLNSNGITDKIFFEIASKINFLVKEFETTLIVESRPDFATLLNSDVYIFSNSDIDISIAKKILPENIILGYAPQNITYTLPDVDFYFINECELNEYKTLNLPIIYKKNKESNEFLQYLYVL